MKTKQEDLNYEQLEQRGKKLAMSLNGLTMPQALACLELAQKHLKETVIKIRE